VILCSLGARYKSYCASISRTFLVDVPSKIENIYNILLLLYNRCLEAMIKGIELKEVYENAKKYLNEKDSSLLAYLPKSLGFSIGLEFRDSSLVLNGTNTTKFVPGMVFNLSIGFHNIPLTEEDTKGCPEPVKKLSVFSLLIADIVTIKDEGVPEVLTKLSKEFSDISYKIGDQEGEGEEGESDGESGDENVGTEVIDGVRRSTRAREEKAANEVASSRRGERQQEIMKKKLEEGKRRVSNGANGSNEKENIHEIAEIEAKDLSIYKSAEEYPRDLINNRLKVDLDKEVLFVPINGRHIPFHVSTIKSVTQPDPEMRVNFFVPGQALGKEVAKNMQYLVAKYGDSCVFIKELTFRSHDGKNLSSVYQQFQELRRRVRQREQKAEQEKDLVIQTKLIRIKDQRVPRLQEVTIRPQLSGRKCVGTLEAHQNGLRFTSSKAEILDVMYTNVKHAIFQPCDRTTMVLVHFHLKDFIMIGRKKVKDVQFYTEVIEASLNLEGSRRSAYDPDELDDEQREREMRKRLNLAFKEFCSKVEKVAAHYDYNLQIDVPFKKSGFEGNWAKEMVLLQPTTHCLVNLTEWPPFVVTLSDVEHCHMERVTYATKNFDLTFIFKDWMIPPRTITAIDTKYMDIIQDWLNLVEITCTKGPRTINWTDVMKIVRESKDIFYDDHDEYGDSKPAGWLFLSAEASDTEDDEEENADSDFSEDNGDSSEEESASDEDDSDLYDESEDDSDEEDEEDDLEEKGQVPSFLFVFFSLILILLFCSHGRNLKEKPKHQTKLNVVMRKKMLIIDQRKLLRNIKAFR
jgi:nucleosome binding factor SPN SPT16 subunit